MFRLFRSLIILSICFAPVAALAQSSDSLSARGHVVDPADTRVAGVTVILTSAGGNSRHALTDSKGDFEFTGLTPGRYDVRALADGFRADPVTVVLGGSEQPDILVRLHMSGLTETVVISAGYVDTPLSEAPGSVTSLRAADISARQLTTVAGALQLVPGFAIAPTGGAGAITSLFPRGGGSDYTLVLADGIRLNSMGGGFDFGHLTTTGIDQLEVVRGPQSAVFGADAIGGVIQLRSKIGGRPSLSGELETGGYGSKRETFGTTGSLGLFSWGAHVEHFSNDGWTDVAPGTTNKVSNDDDHEQAVAVAGALALSRSATLRVDGRFGSNDRGYPGPFGTNPIGVYGGIDTISRGHNTDKAGSASFTQAWSAQSTLRLQATLADSKSLFASPWGDSIASTRRWTAHAQMDHAISSDVAVSVGADFEGERGESTYIVGTAGQAVPVKRQDAAAFGEARIHSGKRLFVTAGLRADRISRETLEADPMAWQPRPPMAAESIVSVNPRVAASFYARTSGDSAGNWTRIHGTAGTGIRPPSALDIAFTDNPGLKPERSRSTDFGVEQALAGGLVIVDATAFVNHFDDLIVAVGRSLQNFSQFRTDNISNARARGLETSAAIRTRGGIEVRASYTWLDTAILAVDRSGNIAPPPFVVGDPLIRRPRHQASVDVLWAHGPMTAYARIGARGRVLDVEPTYGASGGLFTAQGFVVAAAGASVRLGYGASIVARVDNLLDRQYEAVFGYPAPRRSFTIGVRVAASR